MNVLGITYFTHDTGAALLRDGVPVAMAEEERFSRAKHTTALPLKAVEYCLKEGDLRPEDIDVLAIPNVPFLHYPGRIRYALSIFPRTARFMFHQAYGSAWMVRRTARLKRTLGLSDGAKLVKMEHHVAHAASAFLCSPFEEAAILTMDGRGEWPCVLLAHGKGSDIKVLKKFNFPHSLGGVYRAFTTYLGFPEFGSEYKVMGLSAYGSPKYLERMRDIMQWSDGRLVVNQSYMNYHIYNRYTDDRFTTTFEEVFGPRRVPGSAMEQRHMDVAASLQARLNEVGAALAEYLRRETGSRNLCLAGGVALNGVMNYEIKQTSGYDEVFVQPASSDTGLCLGAALHATHCAHDTPRAYEMDHTYWGPAFEDEEILREIEQCRLPFQSLDDPSRTAAELIEQGQVIGWFQGRMEFGPRALGNRSILADPRRAEMKDVVNARIKFREEFRPFAPSVLEERVSEYFEGMDRSPFMLFVGRVKEEKRDIIPAVTHLDGTARIQTVSQQVNPLYYRLISEFHKRTGVPVVLNTSFNVKGEPIICTPTEAIRCFYSTGLDHLILGSYLISKAQDS